MQYPRLGSPAVSRQTLDVFRGYNANLHLADGEFSHMHNMSSDGYPVLSPRGRRGVYIRGEDLAGMIGKDALCYADGEDFYINGYKIDNFTLCTACDTCTRAGACEKYAPGKDHCPKELISMGAYVVILPDKLYINTQNHGDRGDIEARFVSNSAVTLRLHRLDGAEYPDRIPVDKPAEPADGDLWIDTAVSPHVLKQWSGDKGQWQGISTTYVRLECPGIGRKFNRYDGVTLSGLAEAEVTEAYLSGQLGALEGSAVIWEKGEDYVVIAGMLDSVATVTSPIRITRQMPYMDYVVEAGNRLWGCRYGTARNGEVVNELYGSKLGDFKNWNCFMGISTDSWVGALGSDGVFTGAATHLGSPLFFKENTLHKVYISSAGAHQIQDTACRGVQSGCHRSLAIVGETLFYKSRSGVMAYDGSLPQDASYALAGRPYGQAVAGVLGNKYYVSMADEAGQWHLFVYDVAKGLWHREDDLRVEQFCTCRGELYAIDRDAGQILTLGGSGEPGEKQVHWLAETGPMGITTPDMKYVSRIHIRLHLAPGSRIHCSARYDSQGIWEHLFTLTGTDLRSFCIPVRPKRCDHLQLRLEGEGEMKLYSLTKTVEEGSDVV